MIKAILIIALQINCICTAQGIIAGIKFGGIGYHPKSTGNEKFYKRTVNKRKNIALFSSITFCISYNFNEFVGVKSVQTILIKDCANKFGGISHIGINIHDRVANWKNEQYRASFSFGPLFYYRKNWIQIEGYKTESNFMKLSENKIWERKFIWYGGQIQFELC